MHETRGLTEIKYCFYIKKIYFLKVNLYFFKKMNELKFFKMHGLGNDFVIIDIRETKISIRIKDIIIINDRRTGVGCDQLILIEESSDNLADCRIKIFNADGSEAENCGNALRCVGKLLFDTKKKNNFIIETKSGLIDVEISENELVSVDMGIPKFDWRDIPLSHPFNTSNLEIDTKTLKGGSCVNVGNPHVVFFQKELNKENLIEDCKKISNLKIFEDGVNINIANIKNPDLVELIVYERGVGFTNACGTGACATLAVCKSLNLTKKKIKIVMPGGELSVEILNDGHIIKTGPASKVFTGILNNHIFDEFI